VVTLADVLLRGAVSALRVQAARTAGVVLPPGVDRIGPGLR
jgi:hypothetical protein